MMFSSLVSVYPEKLHVKHFLSRLGICTSGNLALGQIFTGLAVLKESQVLLILTTVNLTIGQLICFYAILCCYVVYILFFSFISVFRRGRFLHFSEFSSVLPFLLCCFAFVFKLISLSFVLPLNQMFYYYLVACILLVGVFLPNSCLSFDYVMNIFLLLTIYRGTI